jgi:hypothetical protein
MDPTGLLGAVLAVAVYPGAIFIGLAALMHRRLAGRRGAVLASPGTVPVATLVPALAATVAASMLPLTGSPALRLPPPAGAAGNVIAVAVLLAIAVDLGTASRRVALLAAAAALPVLALAAAGSTLSVLAIALAGSPAAVAARSLSAALLLLAAATSSGSRAASVVVSALALAAAALVLPAVLSGVPPVLGALAALGVVATSGVLARLRDRWSVRALTVAGTAGAVGGTVLALLSVRA